MAPEKKKLTAVERKKIEEQIASLQASLEDEADADPGKEQKAAAADVEAERQKLAALFDRLGIGEEDWDLIAGAFATGTEARTRAIVREELAAEEEAQDERKPEKALAHLEGNPGAPPVDPDTPPQNSPKSGHWTEKKLFGKRDEPDEEK